MRGCSTLLATTARRFLSLVKSKKAFFRKPILMQLALEVFISTPTADDMWLHRRPLCGKSEFNRFTRLRQTRESDIRQEWWEIHHYPTVYRLDAPHFTPFLT